MLTIRPFKPSDADIITTWFNSETVFRFWSRERYDRFPLPPEDMLKKYSGGEFIPMTAEDDGKTVGHFCITFPEGQPSTLRLCFIIVDSLARGKGYGKKMLSLAFEHAFSFENVDRVTLGVFTQNESAINCYKALGMDFCDPEVVEYFTCMGESWKYMDMEITRDAYNTSK